MVTDDKIFPSKLYQHINILTFGNRQLFITENLKGIQGEWSKTVVYVVYTYFMDGFILGVIHLVHIQQKKKQENIIQI